MSRLMSTANPTSNLIARQLTWRAGPATEGGDSTAGDGAWLDGEKLLIVINHPDGRTVALVSVLADGDMLDLMDPTTGDIISEWVPDDIAWWSVITDETLPTE